MKSHFWIYLAILAAVHNFAPVGSVESKPPNFVIFLADDAGIGDFGCFGNTTLRTPNVDRIAREGAKLSQHLAAASLCTPSRAASMTGRYPVRSGMAAHHGVRVNFFISSLLGLPNNETTYAELVKEKDYATGYIGKWHLGLHSSNTKDYLHHPMKQGYDYYYGTPLSNMRDFADDGHETLAGAAPRVYQALLITALAGVFVPLILYKRGLGLFSTILLMLLVLLPTFYIDIHFSGIRRFNSMMMRGYEVVEHPIDLEGNVTQKLVKEAVDYLKKRQDDKRPFLLTVAWLQVHTKLHTAKEFKGRSAHGDYGDNVEEMDWATGEILNAMDQFGMEQNTFVYFSSDHGAHHTELDVNGNIAGGHNGIYKGGKTMGGWEGGIRVVGAAKLPGVIPAGQDITVPTSQMDLFATIADLAEVQVPQDRVIDGRSMMPLLTGKSKDTTHEVLIHHCGTAIHAARYAPKGSELLVVVDYDMGWGHLRVTDSWKLHYTTPRFLKGTTKCGFVCTCWGDGNVDHHDPPLLFNLAHDPSEDHPLDPTLPKHQAIIEHVAKEVAAFEATVESVPSQFTLDKLLPRPWLQEYCKFPTYYC